MREISTHFSPICRSFQNRIHFLKNTCEYFIGINLDYNQRSFDVNLPEMVYLCKHLTTIVQSASNSRGFTLVFNALDVLKALYFSRAIFCPSNLTFSALKVYKDSQNGLMTFLSNKKSYLTKD